MNALFLLGGLLLGPNMCNWGNMCSRGGRVSMTLLPVFISIFVLLQIGHSNPRWVLLRPPRQPRPPAGWASK